MNNSTLTVSLNNPTSFEFDLIISGVGSMSLIKVRFNIEETHFIFSVPCESDDTNENWTVIIPPLDKMFSEGSYPYTIEILANGYYFVPVSGTVHVEHTNDSDSVNTQGSVDIGAITKLSPNNTSDSDSDTENEIDIQSIDIPTSDLDKQPNYAVDQNTPIILQLNKDVNSNNTTDAKIKSVLRTFK
jgi:hypothetical protein